MPVLGPTASTVGGPNRLREHAQALDQLEPGEPGADAEVRSPAEGDVGVGVGTVEDEGSRRSSKRSGSRLAVSKDRRRRPPSGTLEVVPLEGLLGSPGQPGDDPAVAEDLLDRVGDELRVGGEPLPVVGVLGEQQHGGGELAAGRLGAGEHEAGDHADDVVLGQAVPVDLGLDAAG